MNRAGRVRVKICGITRVQDALLAARLGADAIGLIFTARSPRCLQLEQAAKIVRALPPFVSPIALVMDPEPGQLEQILEQVKVDGVQFHGQESDAECRRFGMPYIKALPVDATRGEGWEKSFPNAAAFVIDSHAGGAAGGTGKSFDWLRFPQMAADDQRPLILAGGLGVDNVGLAIRQCRPYAVDVSSGVESRPGIKDADLVYRFIEEVKRAEDR